MQQDQLYRYIRHITSKYIDRERYRVFLFGSRATKSQMKFSDVDIGISGDKPVPRHIMQYIKEDFENSPIPYKVDVVDFSTVSKQFKNVSLRKIHVLS